MNVAEVTKSLQKLVASSQRELEDVLRGPVKEYLEAMLADRSWFAAVMHTSGSEADEALRFGRALDDVDVDSLTLEVTKKLASGIVSTSLLPAVLPAPLLTSTNQAIISCLREQRDERVLDSRVVEEE
jgi:hypothetical protein